MAQGFYQVIDEERVRPMVIAKGSEVFTVGTPVSIDTNGFLIAATSSGEKIWGYCTETVTPISTNSSGSSVGGEQNSNSSAVGYAPRVIAPDNVLFWADGNVALTQTKIGEYCDIASSSSGVVTLNTNASGASGQFIIIELMSVVDPQSVGDTDRVIVKASEPQDLAFAQA